MNETKSISWYRNGFYTLYSDGKIRKPDGYISDGRSWEFLGLLEKKPFGTLGRFIPRKDCFDLTRDQLYYKNGKPRFYVVDLDHGTRRVWRQ